MIRTVVINEIITVMVAAAIRMIIKFSLRRSPRSLFKSPKVPGSVLVMLWSSGWYPFSFKPEEVVVVGRLP